MEVLIVMLLGLASGIISAIIMSISGGGAPFFAGFIFGLAIAIYFNFRVFKGLLPTWKAITFIFSAGLSYIVACINFFGVQWDAGFNPHYSIGPTSFISPSLFGAFLFLLAFHYLIHKLSKKQFLSLLVLSPLLSIAGDEIATVLGGKGEVFISIPILIIWQMGMALGLYFTAR